MQETNVSVPKANAPGTDGGNKPPNANNSNVNNSNGNSVGGSAGKGDTDGKMSANPMKNPDGMAGAMAAQGVKKAGKSGVSAGAGIAAKSAMGSGLVNGAAHAGKAAVHGFAQMLRGVADGIANFIGNTVGKTFIGKAIGKGVNMAIDGISNAFGFVSNLVGTVGTAITGAATAATVTVTVVAASTAMTTQNNMAAFDDGVPAYANCVEAERPVGSGGGVTGSGGQGGTSQLGTEKQQENAYIVYSTLFAWFRDSFQSENAENQAWGVLANMLRESGFNPACLEGHGDTDSIDGYDYEALAGYGGLGVGLCQWTDAQKDIAKHAKNWNMPWDTVDYQLRLIVSRKDPYTARMSIYIEDTQKSTPEECDIAFLGRPGYGYERPAEQYRIQRTNDAPKDIATVKAMVNNYATTHNLSLTGGTAGTGNLSPSQAPAPAPAPDQTSSPDSPAAGTGEDADSRVSSILSFVKDVSSGSGGVGGEAMNSVAQNTNDECGYSLGGNGVVGGGNSDIATAAITFAWPTRELAAGNNGTSAYQNIVKVLGNGKFQDCGGCAAAAVAWSGADDKFAETAPGTSDAKSFFEKSERWQYMGRVTWNEDGTNNCQPGDILLLTPEARGSAHGHFVIWTGTELMQQLQPNATEGANAVDASMGSRSAGCRVFSPGWSETTLFDIWRCVNPENSLVYAEADKGKKNPNAGTRPGGMPQVSAAPSPAPSELPKAP